MRIDKRLEHFRKTIMGEVIDWNSALWLLTQYDKLVEQVADEVAKAWHKGSQQGFDRGWDDGYEAGFADGQEAD